MNKFQDVFISYGRADSKAFAKKLNDRLVEQGLEVWFDFDDIPLGVDYQNQIDDGIEKADNFLFIIAPHSINSAYCRKEIELALKRKKRIIPLLHVELISKETWQQRFPKGTEEEWEAYKAQGKHSSFTNMHPEIGKINWVYFRENIDDFEAAFQGLLAIIERQKLYVHQHTVLLAKALAWKRHQKQSQYLLIGEERQEAEQWLKVKFKEEQPPCTPAEIHCEYITESIKNGNNLMTQVFISYADEDRTLMERIRNSLRREGITVWTNKTDIQSGEAFDQAIRRGIEQADNLVFLLSPNSVNSSYSQLELDLALSLNKRIIPVLVSETDPNQVPIALRFLQYIDLTDNVKEDDYLLDESQLLKILHEDAAYYNEHKVLLTKALKWKRQNENPSILLRGYNLRSAETWLKVAQKRIQHPPTALQEEFIAQSLQQPPLESLDVFVSYSRADSDFARKLNDTLQMQGKTTWFDQESIASGSDFQQEIYRGIKVCHNFLFILSPRSVNSPYCKDEVEYATKLHKRFVTVLHREVNPSDLHPELAKVQWIDFNQNDRDFNANFNQLVRTLDTDREYVHSHSKWLQLAIEWEQKGKSEDLLLRGSEFAIAQNWLQEAETQKKRPAATPLQKEFIKESGNAIVAGIREQKRRIIILRSLLVLVSFVAALAVGAGWMAVQNQRRAEKEEILALEQSSEARLQLGQEFDALLIALKAARKLKTVGWAKNDSHLRAEVVTGLQQSLYSIKELNRLESHEGDILDVSLSSDGTIATIGDDKTVKLWGQDGSFISSKTFEDSEKLYRYGGKFSPDGQILATPTNDKKVKLWRRDGTFISILEDKQGLSEKVFFSPDSRTIATLSGDCKTIKLWQQDGKIISVLKDEQGISMFAQPFSPDGQTIATTNYDRAAKLYVVKLWRRNGTVITILKGHDRSILDVAFSPDGETIATASEDTTVKLWRRNGTSIATLKDHNEAVNQVRFSPDGQKIVTSSTEGTIKLWRRNGTQPITLKDHEQYITDVSFSPDGQTFATASGDKTIRLWRLDGTPIVTLTGHNDWVTKVRFSNDNKMLVSLSDDTTVKLWKPENNSLITAIPSDNQAFSFNSNQTLGQIFATIVKNGSVNLWKTDGTSTPIATLMKQSEGKVDVNFLDRGQTLVTVINNKNKFYGPVQLWKVDGTPVATLIEKTPSLGSVSVSASVDGQTIVTKVDDQNSYGPVQLWKADGTPVATLIKKTPNQGSVRVSISRDGQTILTTVDEQHTYGLVQLWKADGTPIATLIAEKQHSISATLSSDGQTIVTSIQDENSHFTGKLWKADGTLIKTLIEKRPESWNGSFSNDSQMFVISVNDGSVTLGKINGMPIITLIEKSQGYTNIAGFSPDNKTVALKNQKEITLWSTNGSKESVISTGHKGDISAVVFSPDGQRIATASYDNTVKLWQRDGTPITTYTYPNAVKKVNFSTDGKMLISVDEKNTVTVRRLDGMTDLDQLLARGCQWMGVYLNTNLKVKEGYKQICESIGIQK